MLGNKQFNLRSLQQIAENKVLVRKNRDVVCVMESRKAITFSCDNWKSRLQVYVLKVIDRTCISVRKQIATFALFEKGAYGTNAQNY